MWIEHIIAIFEATKYPVLFLGSYFEGSVAMMAGGLLWRLGEVSFWPMFLTVLAADFLSDMMWYTIGYWGARPFLVRWGRLIKVTPELIDKVERLFKRHHTWILIASKLTMGFGMGVATLMTAGMLRVPLGRFMVITFTCGVIWVGGLVFIGYYFGNVLADIPTHLQIIFGVLGLAAFFFALRAINGRLSKADW